MTFNPSKAGYEAGLVLWWNQFSYATIGVGRVKLADGKEVQTVVRRSPTGQAGVMNVSPPPPARPCPTLFPCSPSSSCRPHGHRRLTFFSPRGQTIYPFLEPQDAPECISGKLLSQGPLNLVVHCQGAEYALGVRQGASEEVHQGTCRAEDLTVLPPVGGAFAGVMFGVYAFGNGGPVLDPADFRDIQVVDHKTGSEKYE